MIKANPFMVVQVTFPHMSGKRGFHEFELEAGGSVNDDWADPELRYGIRPQSRLATKLGLTDEDLDSRTPKKTAVMKVCPMTMC